MSYMERERLIIGIAGGSGSGKTTLTDRLARCFDGEVTVVSHDDYYRARDDLSMEERRHINYDHPNAFETELLVEHMDSPGSVFRMNHASNYLVLRGTLNQDKAAMLREIHWAMEDESRLRPECFRAL